MKIIILPDGRTCVPLEGCRVATITSEQFRNITEVALSDLPTDYTLTEHETVMEDDSDWGPSTWLLVCLQESQE